MSFIVLCLIMAIINGFSNIFFSIVYGYDNPKLYINLIVSWLGVSFSAALPIWLMLKY